MRTALPFAIVAALVSLAPIGAHAQDEQPSTFADVSGGVWGVAAAETSLLLSMAVASTSDDCRDDEDAIFCILSGVGGAGLLGSLSGLAAGDLHAPPHVAFATHQLLWMSALGFGFAAGAFEMAGMDEDVGIPIGMLAGVLFGAAAAAWVADNSGAFYDTDAEPALHLMMWGPMSAGMLTGMLAAVAEADGEVVAFLVGLAGLVTWVVAGIWVDESRQQLVSVGTPTIEL